MKKLSALLLVLVLILSLAACGKSPASDDPATSVPEESGSADNETPPSPSSDDPAGEVPEEDGSAGIETPAPSASGIWEIITTDEDELYTITMTLEFGENGMGYVREQHVPTQGPAFTIYYPVSWTDTAITAYGESFSYTWEADSLTVETDNGTYVFTRIGDAEKRIPLQPGTYSLVSMIMNGQDWTARNRSTTVTVNEDGTGVSEKGDHTATFTWDAYFITFDEDGKQYYYTFDGMTLTEYQRSLQITFTFNG